MGRDSKKDFTKSKGKAKYSKGNKNRSKSNVRESYGTNKENLSSLNDISWYSRYPELLAAAARLPFPNKPGMQLDAGTFSYGLVSGSPSSVDIQYTVPGVMSIGFDFSIGVSANNTSAASMTAKEMFARIRSKFSGSLDEDPPDLLMYALALDAIHAYIATFKRIYKVCNLYSPVNRDYPDVVLAALGITNAGDRELWRKNKTMAWGYINSLVHMANKFFVPKDMDLYTRHRWMCENVYLDEDSPMSQQYVFVPTHFWKVNDTTSSGTSLDVVTPNWTSPENAYTLGLQLIQALTGWEDAYTINGHIERAYEGSEMYIADTINYEDYLSPVYVPEVLSQIENARPLGGLTNLTVTQDPTTNAVLFTPKTGDGGYYTDHDKIVLNLHVDNPTAADIVLASRLTGLVTDTSTLSVTGGTELVNQIDIWFLDSDGSVTNASRMIQYGALTFTANTSAEMGALAKCWCQYSAFMHKPILYIAHATSGTLDWVYLAMNVHNVNSFDEATMREIHRVCVYSEFNCFG